MNSTVQNLIPSRSRYPLLAALLLSAFGATGCVATEAPAENEDVADSDGVAEEDLGETSQAIVPNPWSGGVNWKNWPFEPGQWGFRNIPEDSSVKSFGAPSRPDDGNIDGITNTGWDCNVWKIPDGAVGSVNYNNGALSYTCEPFGGCTYPVWGPSNWSQLPWYSQIFCSQARTEGGRLNVFLFPGHQMKSQDKRFTLVMQGDGNLVLYKAGAGALWHSNTYGKGAFGGALNYAVMQGDGNLVVYDWFGAPQFATGSYGKGGDFLVLQNDGNLVIYTNSGKPVWDSKTCCH